MASITTKAELSDYAGYETSEISDTYYAFIDAATLDFANKATGNSYTDANAPPSFKMLCLMMIAEFFKARQRTGAEAKEVTLNGVKSVYSEISTKDEIKTLISANRAIYA